MCCGSSFLGCGNECVICLFRYNADQYVDCGMMWQVSQFIADCVRLEIVNTQLTLTIIISKQPLYTQYIYATKQTLIIDIQYCVCMCSHLHPAVVLPLNFYLTCIHAIWVREDVALSHSCAFGQQFVACRSFHGILVHIGWLPHHSLSSLAFSIEVTYHNQFQSSQPCARGLCGELCHGIHGEMQHDSSHWNRFIISPLCSFHDTYDITQLNILSIFRH
jgi:hypothetical protein